MRCTTIYFTGDGNIPHSVLISIWILAPTTSKEVLINLEDQEYNWEVAEITLQKALLWRTMEIALREILKVITKNKKDQRHSFIPGEGRNIRKIFCSTPC